MSLLKVGSYVPPVLDLEFWLDFSAVHEFKQASGLWRVFLVTPEAIFWSIQHEVFLTILGGWLPAMRSNICVDLLWRGALWSELSVRVCQDKLHVLKPYLCPGNQGLHQAIHRGASHNSRLWRVKANVNPCGHSTYTQVHHRSWRWIKNPSHFWSQHWNPFHDSERVHIILLWLWPFMIFV